MRVLGTPIGVRDSVGDFEVSETRGWFGAIWASCWRFPLAPENCQACQVSGAAPSVFSGLGKLEPPLEEARPSNPFIHVNLPPVAPSPFPET